MSSPAISEFESPRTPIAPLVQAGLLTGASDGLFATVLTVFFYDSTAMRLWQGVASVLIGKSALEGGVATALLGLLMHFGVAFAWSAIFLFVVMRAGAVRTVLASSYGVLKVAAIYGPFIWLVMSLVVIPTLLHKAPSITSHWWHQLIGHIPFVATPMITMIARGVSRTRVAGLE